MITIRAAAAMMVALVACGGTTRPKAGVEPGRSEPAKPGPPPFIVTRGEVLTVTRDQSHLWWITAEAIFRRPIGGPEAGVTKKLDHAVGALMVAFAGHRDHAYVCTASQVMSVGLDGTVSTIAEVHDPRDIAVDDRGLYLADSSGVVRIGADGTRVQVIGGSDVRAIVVFDGLLYRLQEAEVFVTTTDGDPVKQIHVGATGMFSVDSRGVVVRTELGDLLEVDAAGVTRLHGWVEGPWRMSRGAVVAGDDWLYVDSYTGGGGAALLALPRSAAATPAALETGYGYLSDLEASAGEVFWNIDSRTMRGDPTTGTTSIVAEDMYAMQLEVTPRWIYVGTGYGVNRVSRTSGQREALDGGARGDGLEVTADVAAWMDGTNLRVWRDGKRYELAVIPGLAWFGGIVIGADTVYVASGHGIYKVDETGGVALTDDGLGQVLRLAMVASEGDLYVLTATGAFRVTADAKPTQVLASPADDTLTGMTACGARLYAVTARSRIIRVDPGGPDPVVMQVAPRGALPATGALACDDDFVYVNVASAARIVRLPHDAPALPSLE